MEFPLRWQGQPIFELYHRLCKWFRNGNKISIYTQLTFPYRKAVAQHQLDSYTQKVARPKMTDEQAMFDSETHRIQNVYEGACFVYAIEIHRAYRLQKISLLN